MQIITSKIVYLCLVFMVLLSPPAAAGQVRGGLGAGIFDAFDQMDTLTGSLTLEAKPVESWWNLRPTLQILAINESGYYVGVGAIKEFSLSGSYSCGLGFSAGAAHDSRESRALRYDIEFYSRVFLQRKISGKDALRLELGHISNGGLHETNPGTEPLLLFWMHSF